MRLFGTLRPCFAIVEGVTESVIIQGRPIGPPELAHVLQLLRAPPDWSRRRLSIQLATDWDWRNPAGQLKDMAARTLLLKLEQRNWIQLPARRCLPCSRRRHKQVLCLEHDTQPLLGVLADLVPLRVEELSEQPEGRPVFESLLHQYHYLSPTGTVGLNLQYLVRDRQGRAVACVLFGAAAWQCAARDRFIGWDAAARQRHLQRLTNNTRFLVLPWVEVRHLASHVLGRIVRRLPADWFRKYRAPLELVETFVDTSHFEGTCYHAANWIYAGQTTGRTRQNKSPIPQAPPKAVWLYPLCPEFRQALCAR